MIVEVYIINVIRAARPQYQFPCILATIFTIVSLSYGVKFPTMAYAESFMQRLIEAFLTGFGIATGVHIVVSSARYCNVNRKLIGVHQCEGIPDKFTKDCVPTNDR